MPNANDPPSEPVNQKDKERNDKARKEQNPETNADRVRDDRALKEKERKEGKR